MAENNENKNVELVLNTLKPLKGVIETGVLSKEDKKKVLELEADRPNDIIPVRNEGLESCFDRDYSVVIIKTADFRIPPAATVKLVTSEGNLLGEELFGEKIIEYQKRDDVIFLSKEFVVYKDAGGMNALGEQEFVLPGVKFEEIEALDEVTDVVSSSPSPNGDLYIKKRFGFKDDPKLASVVIGFNIK